MRSEKCPRLISPPVTSTASSPPIAALRLVTRLPLRGYLLAQSFDNTSAMIAGLPCSFLAIILTADVPHITTTPASAGS